MLNTLVETLTDDWLIEGQDPHQGIRKKAYRETYEPGDAVPASMPCTVRNALFLNERIPDPYEGLNSLETKWVEEKEWWFLRDFDSPEHDDEQRVILRFEGITYRAEVWVNGVQAAIIEGMFRTDDIDVTDLLVDNGPNRLALRIRTLEDSHLDDDGSELRSFVRPQGPVVQCTFYWNWCPHMVPIGIWRPAHLMLRGAAGLDLFRSQTLSVDAATEGAPPETAAATVNLAWDLRNESEFAQKMTIEYKLEGETFNGEVATGSVSVTVPPGGISKDITLSLDDAHLWWTNGLGTPHLHRVSFEIRDDSGQVLDARSETLGIRTLEMRKNADEDWTREVCDHTFRPWSTLGELYAWTVCVNGRSIFAKGSNWVLLDALLRLERQRYDVQLNLVRKSGLNFLRVWGGSLTENDDFYDLCDRYGILIMQEFWLACGNYPAMRHDLFVRCVRDETRRLINRPSLAFYSGGNEFEPDNHENRVLVDKIAATVESIDPEHEFRRGSPYKGDRHGGLIMTPYATRNKYSDILYGDGRMVHFRSEVATGRSLPSFSALDKFVPDDKRWPLDPELWKHFFAVPSEVLSIAREYDSEDSFEHAVYAQQLYHSALSRYNMEYCRITWPQCTGNLNWQFNVPWPCMHRELVDTWGGPKPVFYIYKNSSTETLIAIDMEHYLFQPQEELALHVHVVHDGWQGLDGLTADLRVFRASTGKALHEQSIACSIDANSAARVGDLCMTIPADCTLDSLVIRAELRDKNETLSTNWYWIAVSNHAATQNQVDLMGDWQREDGSTLQLPGHDTQLEMGRPVIPKVPDPGDLEALSAEDAEVMANATVTYTREFDVLETMAGLELEFFSPGIEASDEISINGTVIGSHEWRPAEIDVRSKAFIPYDKNESSLDFDPESEYPFSADPALMPRVEPRFYDIPAGLLKPGRNEIRMHLKTRYRRAVPRALVIRERTPNRDEVRSHIRSGQHFAALRKLPQATVEAEIRDGAVHVVNKSDTIAFFVHIEIPSNETATTVPLTDNALSLMPGEERVLTPLTDEVLEDGTAINVHGWNL